MFSQSNVIYFLTLVTGLVLGIIIGRWSNE